MSYVFNPFTGNLDWTVTGVPILTTGGITFGSTTGTLIQDTSNLHWQDTQNILGVSSTATEKILNGSFTGNANNWTLNTGWTYANNSVSHSTNGTGTLSQSWTITRGERYDITFTLSAFTAGTVTVTLAGNTLGVLNTAGIYTYRIIAINTSGLVFIPSNTARFTVDNVSVKNLTDGSFYTGNINIDGAGESGVLTISGLSKSNANPGTDRLLVLQNSGNNTWIDFNFGSVQRANIGANSSGAMSLYAQTEINFLNRTTNVRHFQANSTFLSHIGQGRFGGAVHAGLNAGASSTLQSAGSTALKIKYVTSNTTLDDTATKWIVKGGTSGCTGTPDNSCASYTTEEDCLANQNHGGCTWDPGASCSDFDGDETTCTNTVGCTWDIFECSVYDGDQSSCEADPNCTWDNDNSTCSGSYGIGTCSGTYDQSCSGTATCSGITNEADCIAETGCSFDSTVTLTLPDMTTCSDRDYWIYNDSDLDYDVIITPTGNDTIDYTTSYTLSTYKDWVHISPLYRSVNCATFTVEECETYTGCSVVDDACEGTYVISQNWYVFGR